MPAVPTIAAPLLAVTVPFDDPALVLVAIFGVVLVAPSA